MAALLFVDARLPAPERAARQPQDAQGKHAQSSNAQSSDRAHGDHAHSDEPLEHGAPASLPADGAIGSGIASPNMLACARLSAGGRSCPDQWLVAVGSSVRDAVEVWTVRTGRTPLALRALTIQLPPRQHCHGLALGRAHCLLLCSRAQSLSESLFSAQYARCQLQLQAFALPLEPMPSAVEAQRATTEVEERESAAGTAVARALGPAAAVAASGGERGAAGDGEEGEEADARSRKLRLLELLGPQMVEALRLEAQHRAREEDDDEEAKALPIASGARAVSGGNGTRQNASSPPAQRRADVGLGQLAVRHRAQEQALGSVAQEQALAALMQRLRLLAGAYEGVEWGVSPLLSVEEASDQLTIHVRLRKVSEKRAAP
jgi:hypothetical protein